MARSCEGRSITQAQIATDVKSNEITAVPKLLAMLSLQGTIVTTDALNCQRAIARQIVDQGSDYALALKQNQGTLHKDVLLFLDDPASSVTTRRHPRSMPVMAVSRRARPRFRPTSAGCRSSITGPDWPPSARPTASEKPPAETAYFVLSTPLSPERLNEVVRSHWGVENRLHWRLDVVMNEDQDRTRLGDGPHNLAVLRHMALNVMQKDGAKGSLRGKFKRAGWNEAFLAKLLTLF
jgi:predicted transposase YbfD/YdcC